MRFEYLDNAELSRIEDILWPVYADPQIQGVMMLMASDTAPNINALDKLLIDAPKPIFGGIFPALIWQAEMINKGVIFIFFDCPLDIMVLPDLKTNLENIEHGFLAPVHSSTDYRATMFTFVDGVSEYTGALISSLFNQFGLEFNYIGGGCGHADFRRAPCVITPQGVLESAAVVGLVHSSSRVGVAHGWTPISPAFKVTGIDGNSIVTLDWQPAFTVYQQVVEAHAQQPLTAQNFSQLAKAYPFGIANLGDEMVVRDPVREQDGRLLCVGAIRKGAYVHVLHGDPQSLLAAARRANEKARALPRERESQCQILVDCVSRALFLGPRFAEELAVIQTPGLPMLGALTIGEIANSGQDYLEFFNKTAVVGLL